MKMAANTSLVAVLAAIATITAQASAEVAAGCKAHELDFIMLEGDATHAVVEDDIRADLEKVGFTVNARPLVKADLNSNMTAGKFDLVFSETWGAPYDPHSYLSSWKVPNEAHYPVMKKMAAPLDPASFATTLDDIYAEADQTKRQTKITDLLGAVHSEAFNLPLWGKQIPSIVRKSRLQGYKPGYQQFDYPIQKAAVTGSKNVTVSPGAKTGLFKTVGAVDPHEYGSNEFFSSNWVYEGLLRYGANGQVEPSLATSWEIKINAKGAETVRFALRANVKFHDGAAFNCAAVKLNFDHVFHGPLTDPDYHGWYDLPGALAGWSCEGETFVLETSKPYYPLLQELTYIRPLRMLSPNAFVDGIDSSPTHNNSCPARWGSFDSVDGKSSVTCVGTLYPSGTGPFKYESGNLGHGTVQDRFVFAANADYWDGAPKIEFLHLVRHDSAAEVKAALLSGELDAVLGSGVLPPTDVKSFESNAEFEVLHSAPTTNVVLIMNIDDINVRKTIMYAINTGSIIEKELAGIEKAVTQLFPEAAPYCGAKLEPTLGYDIDKAKVLNCNAPAPTPAPSPPPAGTSAGAAMQFGSFTVGLFAVAAAMLN